MKITDEQIQEAAKQWGQEDPDEEKTDVTRALADTARRSFIKGASWMQEQSKSEWISVKDRLPEIGQYVQACIPGGVLLYSCVLEKNNTWYGYGYAQPETRITHWKPLPSCPTT